MPVQSDTAVPNHLDRLLHYLEADPLNLALLGDAAQAAHAAGDLDLASGLLERYRDLAQLPPSLVNVAGLLALSCGRPHEAIEHFSAIREKGIDDPGLRFNLAWSFSLSGDFAQAANLLDDEAVASSSRGPSLKMQALHHLGDLQLAMAEGAKLLSLYPRDPALLGSMANLAMDAEDILSARAWALAAPENHLALAVLGMLALDEGANEAATDYFDRALAIYADSPRAQIGKGLGELAAGHYVRAADLLHKGATAFVSHLGSWVAAGWACLLAEDRYRAESAFRQALDIDDTFSEGHGGLAMLALMAGDLKGAERLCEIALRLDQHSLSGTLVRVMLLRGAGKNEVAERVLSGALASLLSDQKHSLADQLAKFVAKGMGKYR